MKSFTEFTSGKAESSKPSGFPSFSEVKEGKGSSCVSEEMKSKVQEMYESMCKEMKACHEDETENTAESYMNECDTIMKEMMEGLMKECSECMAPKA